LRLPVQVVNGTPAAMTADLLAGRVDAIFQGASIPVPSIKQAADQGDVLVFGLDEAALAAMRSRFPYLTPTVVPGGTYRGNEAPSQTVSAWNFVLAHKDLPDADAYWITRTVLSVADPRTLHPSAAPTRAINAPRNQAVPFHPGALRYYAEQGVTGLK
jgi:TRAP transporter TAXI family solute receptor